MSNASKRPPIHCKERLATSIEGDQVLSEHLTLFTRRNRAVHIHRLYLSMKAGFNMARGLEAKPPSYGKRASRPQKHSSLSNSTGLPFVKARREYCLHLT